jgi:hypothetical protein
LHGPILQNLYRLFIASERGIGQITPMRATRATSLCRSRRQASDRTRQLIRQLRAERENLQEEVKQLSAAIQIYKEVARRASLSRDFA